MHGLQKVAQDSKGQCAGQLKRTRALPQCMGCRKWPKTARDSVQGSSRGHVLCHNAWAAESGPRQQGTVCRAAQEDTCSATMHGLQKVAQDSKGHCAGQLKRTRALPQCMGCRKWPKTARDTVQGSSRGHVLCHNAWAAESGPRQQGTLCRAAQEDTCSATMH